MAACKYNRLCGEAAPCVACERDNLVATLEAVDGWYERLHEAECAHMWETLLLMNDYVNDQGWAIICERHPELRTEVG